MVGLDEGRAVFYTDVALVALSEAARKALEDPMRADYEIQTDFVRKMQRARIDTSHPDELIARVLAASTLEDLLTR